MSELKARTARSIADEEEMLEIGADCPIEPAQVYLKYEVDKLIANKDEKIDLYKRGWEESDRINTHLYAELRRHKYKRCLAMALWCEDEAEINHNSAYEASEYLPSREAYFRKRAEHYERWHKRWRELAEKFKEEK